jgi:hypothetical protein
VVEVVVVDVVVVDVVVVVVAGTGPGEHVAGSVVTVGVVVATPVFPELPCAPAPIWPTKLASARVAAPASSGAVAPRRTRSRRRRRLTPAGALRPERRGRSIGRR